MVPPTLKADSPYDPEIPLLGLCPEELQPSPQRAMDTPQLTALFTIAEVQKQPKCPSVNECINEMREMYACQCNITQPEKERKF